MYPILSSYETMALKPFVLDKILKGIATDNLRGELSNSDMKGIAPIRVLQRKDSDTPAFAHPVIVTNNEINSIYGDDRQVIVDVRTMVSATYEGVKIRDAREYQFRLVRAALEQTWQHDNARMDLQMVSDIPMAVYCRLISEALTQRLGLDPQTQAKLAALAGIFYCQLFEGLPSPEAMSRNLAVTARVTRIPVATILEWFPMMAEEQPVFSSLHHWCGFASEQIGNPRLNKLNPAFLFASLGSWPSQSGNEVMQCALEFPPTWVAMCYMAVDERSLRNSRIGRLVQNFNKGDETRLLQRGVNQLIA